MNERRRFLRVLGGSVVAVGAGCGGTTVEGTGSATGTGGAGGAGGNAGGAGGAGGATSSSASSTASASSSSSSASSSSSSGMVCGPTGVSVGMPSAYATGGLHKVPGTKVLIGRDDGGLYALTALCTHQQCNLNTKGVIIATGIHCNCHGAEFDTQGNATHGPAFNPLKAYALSLECDGNLYVDTTTVVPNTQRLMV